MGEREAETGEGNVMRGRTGTELDMTEKGGEIEIGIMMTEIEIMGEIGNEVDTVIKDGTNGFLCTATTLTRTGYVAFFVRRIQLNP